MAVLHRAGALTAIHVPTNAEEAARDLVRTRETIRRDVLRARQRLGKFVLRHGRRFTRTRSWGAKYDEWLRTQQWELPTLTHTHAHYLRAVDEARSRLDDIEADLQPLVTQPPF